MKKSLLIAIGCLGWMVGPGWSEPPQSPGQQNNRRGWFRQMEPGEQHSGEQRLGRKGHRHKRMEQFDRNGDGQLDDGERQAVREEMGGKHRQRFAQFDTNGDGQLDDGERQALREKMGGKHRERFAQFDTNGDGQLDDGERQALREKMGGKHRERFAQFDSNGDGRLDDGERQALKQQMIQRFDKNGNGKIDPEERPRRGKGRRHQRGGEAPVGPERSPQPAE